MAVLEGEYWKRRLGSITNEYKKWRTISRKHVKINDQAESPTSAAAINTQVKNDANQYYFIPATTLKIINPSNNSTSDQQAAVATSYNSSFVSNTNTTNNQSGANVNYVNNTNSQISGYYDGGYGNSNYLR